MMALPSADDSMVRFLPRPGALARLTLAPFVALFLLSGCGDDSTGPDGPPAIEVSLTADVTTAKPGERVIVTVTADPENGARVSELELEPLGIVASEPVLFAGNGSSRTPVAAKDTFFMPAAVGEARFVAVARGTDGVIGESDTLVIAVADEVPPVIDSVRVTHAQGLAQGDSLSVVVGAHDDAILTGIVVTFAGVVSRSDTVRYQSAEVAGHVAGIRLPAGADVRQTLSITVKALDAGGNEATQALPAVRVLDVTPPTIDPITLPCAPAAGQPCLPGDTVRFIITAHDDHELEWIGYRIGPPGNRADSTRIIVEDGDMAVSFVIPRAMLGLSGFTIFARDSTGNQRQQSSAGFWVYDALRRATVTAALSSPIFDVAYDSARGRIWVSQPAESRLAVYTLAGQLEATITLPNAPAGLDIGSGAMADTLVVALRGTGRIAKIALGAALPTIDTVRVASDASLGGRGLQAARLASGNRLVAVLAGGGTTAQLLVYDLATGTEVARPTLTGADPGFAPQLTRSGDRTAVGAWLSERFEPTATPLAWRWDAWTGLIGPATLTGVVRGSNGTMSPTGARFLVGAQELSSSLSPMGFNFTFGTTPRASALLQTAAHAFFYSGCCSIPEHVQRQDLMSDDTPLERFLLPSAPTEMRVIHGDGVLLAWNGASLHFVSLAPVTPAP